ncbi:hypothetical protein AK51_02145 [Serratia nematodiphila DZ0503SBS1]|nr:hypothetical protein AK51_02145 [Serratia nematodiphila DZ0503SBS1]
MPNHSPPIDIKPTCQVRKPSVSPATAHFSAVESVGGQFQAAQQAQATNPAQQRGQTLQRNDENITGVMQPRRLYRAVADGGVGEKGIHHKDVAHEGEIGAVVSEVTEGHQRSEQGDSADQQRFG